MSSSAPLLSVYQIAEKLQRTPRAIDNAIERLRHSPTFVTPSGHRYFSPEIVTTVAASMRKPNRKK